MIPDLLSLATIACEVAVKERAEFADVGAYRGKNISVELEKDAIKSSDVRMNSGLSVRVFIKGGMGFASMTGLNEDDAVRVAKNAVALSKVAQPDPDFVSLPQPAAYAEVEGLYDRRIADLDVGQVIEWAVANIDSAKSVCPDVAVNGGAGAGFGESALVNSLGVKAYSKGTHAGAWIFAIVKRGDDVGSFYDWDNGRMLDDFQPDGIGAKAAETAVSFLGARKVETKILPIILGPLAGQSIFYAIAMGANAEDVQRNRSYLCEKKGERIASDILTIYDDALIPRGLSSSRYDGEGFPRKRLTLVENGVLLSYLHNSYTANKGKEENTGHSTRGGISPTNINPKLGQMTSDEILKDTKEGIYINMGSVFPNPTTGDFSSTVDFGFKIENGELAYPIHNTMIGGNVIDLLMNIDAISSDCREEPGSLLPTIRVQNVKVAGGK
jgi:PmbA protein